MTDNRLTCKWCFRLYVEDEEDDHFHTQLCYSCFEESLEDWEELRRQRIAEESEY